MKMMWLVVGAVVLVGGYIGWTMYVEGHPDVGSATTAILSRGAGGVSRSQSSGGALSSNFAAALSNRGF